MVPEAKTAAFRETLWPGNEIIILHVRHTEDDKTGFRYENVRTLLVFGKKQKKKKPRILPLELSYCYASYRVCAAPVEKARAVLHVYVASWR